MKFVWTCSQQHIYYAEVLTIVDKQIAVNRDSWDERTPAHAVSELYDVDGFKKGRITLTDIERQEVGDVSGKMLLHLQCYFGLDTM